MSFQKERYSREDEAGLRGLEGRKWRAVREVEGEEEVEAGSENHPLDMCCVAGPEKKTARR